MVIMFCKATGQPLAFMFVCWRIRLEDVMEFDEWADEGVEVLPPSVMAIVIAWCTFSMQSVVVPTTWRPR